MAWLSETHPTIYLSLFILFCLTPFVSLALAAIFHEHTGDDCLCNKEF